jgi:hypothetical protein
MAANLAVDRSGVRAVARTKSLTLRIDKLDFLTGHSREVKHVRIPSL